MNTIHDRGPEYFVLISRGILYPLSFLGSCKHDSGFVNQPTSTVQHGEYCTALPRTDVAAHGLSDPRFGGRIIEA